MPTFALAPCNLFQGTACVLYLHMRAIAHLHVLLQLASGEGVKQRPPYGAPLAGGGRRGHGGRGTGVQHLGYGRSTAWYGRRAGGRVSGGQVGAGWGRQLGGGGGHSNWPRLAPGPNGVTLGVRAIRAPVTHLIVDGNENLCGSWRCPVRPGLRTVPHTHTCRCPK